MPFWNKTLIATLFCVLAIFGVFISSQPSVVSCQYKLSVESKTPQTGLCTLETSVPTKVERLVIEGVGQFQLPESSYSTYHEVPLLGLPPGRDSTVYLELQDQSGRIIDSPKGHLQTPPLPNEMPRFAATTLDSQVTGFTLCTIGRYEPSPLLFEVIFDRFGQVVWYRKRQAHTLASHMIGTGRLICSWPLRPQLALEDLSARNLATYLIQGRRMSTELEIEKDANTVWTISDTNLVSVNLKNREMKTFDLKPLVGQTSVSSFAVKSSGALSVLAVPEWDCLLGFDVRQPGVGWAWGDPERWPPESTVNLLQKDKDAEWPHSPIQVKWGHSGGLTTIETDGESAYLREYTADLNNGRIISNWSFTLPVKNWQSLLLNEGPGGNVCSVAANHSVGEDDFASVFQITKGKQARVVSKVQITAPESERWFFHSVQVLRTPYEP